MIYDGALYDLLRQPALNIDDRLFRVLLSLANGGRECIDFNPVVDLTGARVMPPPAVMPSSLTLVPGPGARINGDCYTFLIADGVNSPTFGGGFAYTAVDGVGTNGWINTPGTVHKLVFWCSPANASRLDFRYSLYPLRLENPK